MSIRYFKPTASIAEEPEDLLSEPIIIVGTRGCEDLARASATPTLVL